MKVARTVWSRGKDGDNFKTLPIAITQNNSKTTTMDSSVTFAKGDGFV